MRKKGLADRLLLLLYASGASRHSLVRRARVLAKKRSKRRLRLGAKASARRPGRKRVGQIEQTN